MAEFLNAGHAVEYFVALANRGDATFASGGEAAAKSLAQAIVNYLPALDENAIEGLIAFIHYAKAKPASAAERLYPQ